jgi:glycine/D-amino acid oxidase-like deaminating enzyme
LVKNKIKILQYFYLMENFSYWEKKNFFSADVIVVGNGIVGLNAAIFMKNERPKLNVIVLERGFLPSGASTKNAGFACFGSISELIAQEELSGAVGLKNLIAKRWQGLLMLRKLLGDGNIAYQSYGGFELFKDSEQTLAEECLNKIPYYNGLISEVVGHKSTYLETKNEINTFGFSNTSFLIKNQLEAQIDPGLMIKKLIAKAVSLGVVVLNNCEVKEIRQESNGVILETIHGLFNAEKVLLSTNAFIKKLAPELQLTPGRGQVIVTKPIKNLKVKGTFHYDKGYYYFRNIDDRILLGGGRNLNFEAEETTEFGETNLVQDALQKLLNEVILPNIPFEIEHKWSGIMGFGPQLEPIIEQIRPGVFCAVRCNGMGIAIGSQTGKEAAEAILNTL